MEKPRLIDADALLKRIKKDPLFPLVEQYGISGVIKAEPTVDAIPIEWMREYIKKRPFALAYGMMEAWALGKEE